MHVCQHSLPQLSCHPRGGFRPLGGTSTRTEIRDFHQERELRPKDEVVLVVHNIDQLWTDKDFEDFLRPLMVFVTYEVCFLAGSVTYLLFPIHVCRLCVQQGTRAIYSAKVVRGFSEFLNAGKGLVSCYNYSDAYLLKKMVHGRNKPGKSEELLAVEYNEKVQRHCDDLKEWKRKVSISEATPAVTRFNHMIAKCGPYWQDAEAVLLRLRDEGHKPTLYTYIALLHSYREARPPQAKKAECLIEQMRSEGIALHTTACNAVVDCWCKAGNMKRAEMYVARMEKNAQAHSIWQPRDKSTALASPNEQTYLILAEGWQRCVRAAQMQVCMLLCVLSARAVYTHRPESRDRMLTPALTLIDTGLVSWRTSQGGSVGSSMTKFVKPITVKSRLEAPWACPTQRRVS